MAMTLDGSNGVTFNDSSLQGAAASPYGLKNRIINGDMRIDQRNAGASVTPSGNSYNLDRWQAITPTVGSKFSVQQQTSVVPTGFNYALKVTSLSAYTVGSTDRFAINQNIEGFNWADLSWGTANAKTVTLSFWVYSSLTGSFGGSLINESQNRSYPFSYTISAANTWEQKTITVTGDTTGTWTGATNGVGVQLYFSLGAGSTYSGTANTWAAADYRQPTGSTSIVGTNGATWYITGVQLEIGSTATPFERRLYNQELANCQRYFEMSYSQGTVPGTSTNVGGQNAVGAGVNDVGTTSYYKATKRTSPTITVYSPSTGTSGAIRNFNTGSDITGVSTEVGDTGFRVYKAGAITAGQYYAYQYIASAEL